jgi:hypothetical protein
VGDCELLGALVQAGAEVERPADRREERKKKKQTNAIHHFVIINSSCGV